MKVRMLLDLERRTTNSRTICAKNQNHECGGRLNVKIHILFHGDNSRTVTLRQTKFGAMKDYVHICKSCLDHCFL
jgi:hypothetical protein